MTITNADIAAAATSISIEPAVLKAVLTVEAPAGGFLPDGQVRILFEPHRFSKLTNGSYDKSHPDISYPKWGTRPYGRESEQHTKLQRAVALDRSAALMAASWGKPQILGENWKAAGASSLQDFINRMTRSEASQLELMVNFIRYDPTLWQAMKRKDWHAIARKYNGTAYRQNDYHNKLQRAYDAAN